MNRSSISVWGPCAWNTLHAVSFAYPVEPTHKDMQKIHAFLFAFADNLPCKRCRKDYRAFLEQHIPDDPMQSPYFSSRENLARFIVKSHNHVNNKLGKREMPFDVVERMYTAVNMDISWGPIIAGSVGLGVIMLVIFMQIHHLKRVKHGAARAGAYRLQGSSRTSY